jgi:hypothetical protein
METIQITDKQIRDHFKEVIVEVIDRTISYARWLNFPNGKKEEGLTRMMHGTEFLHGMLEKRLIDHALYEKLKMVAEDPSIEYKIVIS